MCEQKFEQEQNPLTPGSKILWIVAPENEKRISADLSAFLENFQGFLGTYYLHIKFYNFYHI